MKHDNILELMIFLVPILTTLRIEVIEHFKLIKNKRYTKTIVCFVYLAISEFTIIILSQTTHFEAISFLREYDLLEKLLIGIILWLYSFAGLKLTTSINSKYLNK